MKKLSLFVALVLLVTVGGVYAQWVYAGNDINALNSRSVTVVMGNVTTTGNAGSYSIADGDNTLKATIQPKEAGSYVPSLVWSGSITITFTPAGSISASNLARAKAATLTLNVSDIDSAQYDSKRIFSKTANSTIAFDSNAWVYNSGSNTYTYTIDASALASFVSINEDISLDNIDEYNAFTGEFIHAVFTVDIAPGT